MAIMGYDLDSEGPNNSENAPNLITDKNKQEGLFKFWYWNEYLTV